MKILPAVMQHETSSGPYSQFEVTLSRHDDWRLHEHFSVSAGTDSSPSVTFFQASPEDLEEAARELLKHAQELREARSAFEPTADPPAEATETAA